MNSKVRKNIADSSLPYLMWTHFIDFPSCVMSRGLCDACPILHKLIESQEGVAELVLEKTGPEKVCMWLKLMDSSREGEGCRQGLPNLNLHFIQ